MKKVIDGRIYDTQTAELLCDVSPGGFSRSDFKWEDTALYRTKSGAFFLAGEGGAASRWRKRYGDSGWAPGDGIELIGASEAKRVVEEHCSTERYIELFGEPEEG
jgi:hypothetical protein